MEGFSAIAPLIFPYHSNLCINKTHKTQFLIFLWFSNLSAKIDYHFQNQGHYFMHFVKNIFLNLRLVWKFIELPLFVAVLVFIFTIIFKNRNIMRNWGGGYGQKCSPPNLLNARYIYVLRQMQLWTSNATPVQVIWFISMGKLYQQTFLLINFIVSFFLVHQYFDAKTVFKEYLIQIKQSKNFIQNVKTLLFSLCGRPTVKKERDYYSL